MAMIELISWLCHKGDTSFFFFRVQRIKIISIFEAKVAGEGAFCKVLVNPSANAGDVGDPG